MSIEHAAGEIPTFDLFDRLRVVWPETAWRGLQAGRSPEELAAEHRTTPARITELARRYEIKTGRRAA